MSAIFISYRREDAEDSARALYETLLREFGKDRLFMDVEAIALGTDFREAVESSLDNCGVFLAVIGPDWLDAKLPNDPSGRRRLDSPGDYVRQEVATALKRGAKLPVIPVLVRGAVMPSPDQLPDDLKDLAYRNALTLSHLDWDGNVQKLVSAIKPRLSEGGESQGAAASASRAGTAARTSRTPTVPSTPEPSASPASGLSKPLLFGIPALIIAVVAGYFAFRPSDKAKTTSGSAVDISKAVRQQEEVAKGTSSSATNQTPEPSSNISTSPAVTGPPLTVTLLANPAFTECKGKCSLWIDGVAAASPYIGKPMQLHLAAGQHHFRFVQEDKPLRCEGSFLVAAGQTSFVPRWRNANAASSSCEMQPDQQSTNVAGPVAASAASTAPAPVIITPDGNPQAWQKRSLSIDDHGVTRSLAGPVKLKLAPGQHRFLLTGPNHECRGTFSAAPGQSRFSLQWPSVDSCRIVPAS